MKTRPMTQKENTMSAGKSHPCQGGFQRKFQNENTKLQAISNIWNHFLTALSFLSKWNDFPNNYKDNSNGKIQITINFNDKWISKKSFPHCFWKWVWDTLDKYYWKHKELIRTSMAIINTKVWRGLVQTWMSCMLASNVKELKLVYTIEYIVI